MAGTKHTRFSVQGASNIGIGQVGSVFTNTTANVTPTSGVFVAITMIADTTFTVLQSAEGAGVSFIGNTLSTSGTGTGSDAITTSDTFPAGVTIYGRFTAVDLTSGAAMLYIGA